MNDRLYLHEFIDIIGQNRAQYMYHMTANFSPMAQEDRAQLCYGVWGVLGSTGNWPEVVGWRTMARGVATSMSRILLIDSPFCPFKLGRQPQRADRTEPWDEG